jgi:small multidrug resistance family-3 protein
VTRSAILLLLLTAVLEAGGDTVIRAALHTSSAWPRAILFTLGAGVLFAYGYVVNAPAWDFGRLLGLYVVFFFWIAQVISTMVFRQPLSPAVLLGGGFISIGGIIIAMANR